MGFLNKKNIIRNIMLVIGVIFTILFSILLVNDLQLDTITQWTVMTSYFMIIFLIIGIALELLKNSTQISCPVVTHSRVRSAP